MRTGRFRRHHPWKGAAAGAIAGLAGAWTMNQFQNGWSKLSRKLSSNGDSGARQQSAGQEDGEPATMKAVEKLSTLVGRPMTKEQRKAAAPLVHYAFGAVVGAAYGATVEYNRAARIGAGIPFGTFVFVTADETAVPALHLSKPPTEYPLQTHLYALASHAVYGLTTEMVRRGACRLLGKQFLSDSSSAPPPQPQEQSDHKDHEEDKEQDFGNPRRRCCNSGETKDCGDNRDDQKYQRPIQRSRSFCSAVATELRRA